MTIKCPDCRGKGLITCLAPEGIKEKYYMQACPTCMGLGIKIYKDEEST